MCDAFGTAQTCFQTSGKRIDQIWPDFYVVWTPFQSFWDQGVHFWGQKSKNILSTYSEWDSSLGLDSSAATLREFE